MPLRKLQESTLGEQKSLEDPAVAAGGMEVSVKGRKQNVPPSRMIKVHLSAPIRHGVQLSGDQRGPRRSLLDGMMLFLASRNRQLEKAVQILCGSSRQLSASFVFLLLGLLGS